MSEAFVCLPCDHNSETVALLEILRTSQQSIRTLNKDPFLTCIKAQQYGGRKGRTDPGGRGPGDVWSGEERGCQHQVFLRLTPSPAPGHQP